MIVFEFLLTFSLIQIFLKIPALTNIADIPNHRSLHQKPVPRIGGFAMMISVILASLILQVNYFWIASVGALVLLGLLDDIYDLKANFRFILQLTIVWLFLMFGLHISVSWLVVFLILAIGWLCNLYNFMDGSDGLAGGMAVFGFGSYAIVSAEAPEFLLISTALVASSLAFLCFNFHPAKIFMGDAGSVPLGFLAGAIGVAGWQQGTWPYWFPVLVFSPFIMDATVTLLKRALRGEKVWQAHREHYYQRLVQMGWGHRNTALAAYCLMLATSVTALLMLKLPNMIIRIICIVWLMVYLILMMLIDAKWNRFQLNK